MEELNRKIPDQCLMNNENNNISINREIDSMAEKEEILAGDNIQLRSNSELDDSSDKINDSRRKRRSKNDQNGRKYQCECGKSYLSQPALTNHRKTKHENSLNLTKRGRGRPRKNVKISHKLAKSIFNQP